MWYVDLLQIVNDFPILHALSLSRGPKWFFLWLLPSLLPPSHFFIVIFVTDGNRARGGGRAAGLPPVAGQADFFQDSKRNSIDALSSLHFAYLYSVVHLWIVDNSKILRFCASAANVRKKIIIRGKIHTRGTTAA